MLVNTMIESVFDTFPWPQFEMGSATVPVAESGVAPDSRPANISSSRKSDERGFRRDARAPQNAPGKIDAVAAAARELRRVRAEALPKLKGGLRALSHPRIAPRTCVFGFSRETPAVKSTPIWPVIIHPGAFELKTGRVVAA